MNKIQYDQTGGFPLTTNRLTNMQEALAPLINALGAMAGNLAIISGCSESGNIISDGVVQIGNEIFEFKAGIKQTYVTVFEEKETREFENGEQKIVLIRRYVTFGSGTTNYKWEDFKRVPPLSKIPEQLEDLDRRLKIQEAVNAPDLDGNTIRIFCRQASEIPKGWVAADDYINKILRGGYNVGAEGGSDSFTLTNNNLPALSGSVDVVQPYEGDYQIAGSVGGGGGKWFKKHLSFNIGGNSTPVQYIPAHKIVLFIRFVGSKE